MSRYRQDAIYVPKPKPSLQRMWMLHGSTNSYHPPKLHCVYVTSGKALCGVRSTWLNAADSLTAGKCDRCAKREAGLFNPRLGTGRRHPKLHPTISLLFDLIQEAGVSEQLIAARAGLSKRTLEDWRTSRRWPSFFGLECAFNAVGAKLVVVLPEGSTAKLARKAAALKARKPHSEEEKSDSAGV